MLFNFFFFFFYHGTVYLEARFRDCDVAQTPILLTLHARFDARGICPAHRSDYSRESLPILSRTDDYSLLEFILIPFFFSSFFIFFFTVAMLRRYRF